MAKSTPSEERIGDPKGPAAKDSAPADSAAKEKERKMEEMWSKVKTLQDVRKGFKTRLTMKSEKGDPVPDPPEDLLKVKFPSPVGELAAYVSRSPGDGKKHPAIIWIFGGFSNGIGESAWEEAEADNDQTAKAFRRGGVLTMYPSRRGGNDNPGFREGFFGEVDDILAAADYLAKLDYIDSKRIYLGGHSTGGTLALLVAESTDRFRAVFSFGPVADVSGYGEEELPFDIKNKNEVALRAPYPWLRLIRSPTFVMEGTERGNIDSLKFLEELNENPKIHFLPASGHDHFSILTPGYKLLIKKILADDGPQSALSISKEEMAEAMKR